MIASIIGHNRLTSAAEFGPAIICQTLVVKDGTSSRLAAASGEMRLPSTPIASVGKPMPVMPLTIPAAKNVAAIVNISVVDKSNMALHGPSQALEQCGSSATWLRLVRSLIMR
ncbi:hypothetical protein D3C81_1964820 [compost metagenome]